MDIFTAVCLITLSYICWVLNNRISRLEPKVIEHKVTQNLGISQKVGVKVERADGTTHKL